MQSPLASAQEPLLYLDGSEDNASQPYADGQLGAVSGVTLKNSSRNGT